jgi:hypothetical protein
MSAINSRFGWPALLPLVALVLGTTAARADLPMRDELYRSAKMESHHAMTVAVLPAVAVVDNPRAERLVEAQWSALYDRTSTRWMPADDVRACLSHGSGEPDTGGEWERQVWRDGELNSETAGRLARLLQVHAVLSIRIDRWEIADGGRAMVGMTAALVDSDGTKLWSISGCSGYGRPLSSVERNFATGLIWVHNPDLEPPREDARKLKRALYMLLARWAWSLPEGPTLEPGKAPALIALDHGD